MVKLRFLLGSLSFIITLIYISSIHPLPGHEIKIKRKSYEIFFFFFCLNPEKSGDKLLHSITFALVAIEIVFHLENLWIRLRLPSMLAIVGIDPFQQWSLRSIRGKAFSYLPRTLGITRGKYRVVFVLYLVKVDEVTFIRSLSLPLSLLEPLWLIRYLASGRDRVSEEEEETQHGFH